MSSIKLQGGTGGYGVFTISSPATNSEHTLTLPDATTTAMATSATQTLTNKTFGTGLVMAASTLTSAGQRTASGTSVTLATGLPSWVRSVSVVFSTVSTNGTSPFIIRFGTGTTPTYVTSGYASVSDNYTTAENPTGSSLGFRIGQSIAASSSATAIYTFFRVGTNRWIGQLNGVLDAGSSVLFGGGVVSLPSALTAILFTTEGGVNTFDSGTFTVWYE
jgi:hypothetical protein